MQEEPQEQQQQRSPLLKCLEQLNDDVWRQILLPKLAENKSQADVALTCSSLRTLCQQVQERLSLAALNDSEPPRVAEWLNASVGHFPAMKLVKLKAHQESSYLAIPAMLPALSR